MAQTKVQLLMPNLGDVIDFDSSTLFMDGADNRVGIRNTNPQYELDVTGTINATNFRGNISVGTIDDWITHTGDTNTKFGFPAADTFAVETAGSERFRVGSNGALAIGTDVTAGQGSLFRVGTPLLAAGNDLPDGGIIVTPTSGTIATGQVMPIICAAGQQANPGIARAGIAAVSTSDRSGMDLVFLTRFMADGTSLDVTDDEKVRIKDNGKVGIGISAPAYNLHIKPPTASETVLKIESESGYDARLKLDTSSGGGAEARIDFEEDASIRGWISYTNNSGGTTDDMVFGTATNERLRINAAGDVLLGTDHATIGMNTADGSDNRVWSLCGGSDASQSRGAVITLYGNEAPINSNYGTLSLKSGNTNSSFIDFWTQGAKKVEITKDGVFRIQSTYNGSASTSNAWPALNITNLQGTYTAGNILGGVTFGKAAGHVNGIRAGILAIYQGNGSQAGNVGAHLSFRTSANGAGDSSEKLYITDTGVLCTGNYRGLLDQTMGSIQINGDGSGGRLGFRGTSSSQYCGLGEMHGYWDGNKVASILFHGGASNSNKDDGEIRMYTRPVGSGGQERLRINSTGKLLIGTTKTYYANDYYDDITINNSGGSGAAGGCGITMISNDSSWGALQFGDTNDDDCGYIKYDHNQNKFIFGIEDGSVRFWQTKAKTWFGTTGHGDSSRSSLFDLVGDYQDPTGVWTQMGLYSSDSYAANKGGSIGFGGQDGSTTRQQFAAIKGAKESGTSGNYAGYMAFYTRPSGAVSKENMRIESNGDVAINTTDGDFGQSNGASQFAKGDPKLGVKGSIGIMNTSSTTTDFSQLAFYRRTASEPQGNGSHRINGTHNLGKISWFGASNDTSFPDEVVFITSIANGGDWWSGANRRASLQFHNNNVGEMARYSSNGAHAGWAIMNRDCNGVSGGAWTTHGAWKVLVDLSGYPTDQLYMCDAAMQHLGAYTATFWVYKCNNGHYDIIHEESSLCDFRLNGSQIEIKQSSGVDQTNTTGYQKIFAVAGMYKALT